MSPEGITLRLELYLQAYAQAGAHQLDLVRRLKRLRDAGVVGEIGVSYWPSRTRLGEVGDDSVAEKYAGFREWAESHGSSLPAFRVDHMTSGLTDETDLVLQTPVACLVVYDEDELRGVYPHGRNGEHRSVKGFLTELEDGLRERNDHVQATP